jgi:ATP-dependent Lhr-like helicase
MVYEARAGEVVLLGASAWRIESIDHHRVLVTPAPGEPGKVPFWKGDGVGRPVELGRALGVFTRETWDLAASGKRGRERAIRALQEHHDLDALAAENLVAYLEEEHEVTGALPTDRTIVLQRFRDELGDWRICLLTPFGARVHAPWALAIEARLRESLGVEVQPIWSDDGIVVRLPATEGAYGSQMLDATDGIHGEGAPTGPNAVGPASVAASAESAVLMASEDVEEIVTATVAGSALFASRFRENAARALLLPRRRPGQRTPLWQMRQRASQLLSVASRYGSFPIILETYREVLSDVFDLAALRELLAAIERREVRVVSVETSRASPFASSLLFDYIATYMYEGDAPLLDRRAQALTLDRDLLRELLGAEQLRELLDGEALAELELDLQALTEERAAGSADAVHDLLRRLGDLSTDEVAARVRGTDAAARRRAAGEWTEALLADRRATRMRIGGEERWVAVEDVGRYRDGVGAAPPVGVPEPFLAPARDALATLLARWARSHGPFLSEAPAARWNLPVGVVERTLEDLMAGGLLVRGELRPGGVEREWCDPDVLRLIRRRSLARLRREIEPVEPTALARFLPAWQGVGSGVAGLDRLAEVIAQLEGVPLPASVLERDVLPARVRGYRPQMLDELGAAGEVVWVGAGSLGRDDGRVALYRPDRLGLLLARAPAAVAGDPGPEGWLRDALRSRLAARGASFHRDLMVAALEAAQAGGHRRPTEREILDALWDLVWTGDVSNDTFAPLRALRWPRRGGDRRASPARPRPGARLGPPEAAGRWSLVADTVRTMTTLAGGSEPSATDRLMATALALLERHGVVTRDAVMAEGSAGGFGAVYPIFREMEERGRVRRGYFVEGLGGAQFAVAGAVDRLRGLARDPGGRASDAGPTTMALSAADPANAYGAALPWPRDESRHERTPSRAAGAYVVLHDGELALYLERGGRSLLTFAPFDDDDVASAGIEALRTLLADDRLRRLQIERIDGLPIESSPHRQRLEALGFRRGYRGLVLGPAGARFGSGAGLRAGA